MKPTDVEGLQLLAGKLIDNALSRGYSSIPSRLEQQATPIESEKAARAILRKVHDSLIEFQARKKVWLPECMIIIGDNYVGVLRVHQPSDTDFGGIRQVDQINMVGLNETLFDGSKDSVEVLRGAVGAAFHNRSLEVFPYRNGVAIVDCTSIGSAWGNLDDLLASASTGVIGMEGQVELFPGNFVNAVIVREFQQSLQTSDPLPVGPTGERNLHLSIY